MAIRSALSMIIDNGYDKLKELSCDGGKLDILSGAYSSYLEYEVLRTDSLTSKVNTS